MNILISNADPRPIYEQIYSQIRNAIVSGEAPAESPLPSIRSLAKDLRISVITTKRAYDELLMACPPRGCEYSFANLYFWGLQKIAFFPLIAVFTA